MRLRLPNFFILVSDYLKNYYRLLKQAFQVSIFGGMLASRTLKARVTSSEVFKTTPIASWVGIPFFYIFMV